MGADLGRADLGRAGRGRAGRGRAERGRAQRGRAQRGRAEWGRAGRGWAPHLPTALGWAGLGLLVAGGAPKTVAPYDTWRALRRAGVPLPVSAVRVLGGGEAGLGVAAMVGGNRELLSAAAGSYAAFTAFVLRARAGGTPLSSCGCFGRADTPASATHAAVTATLGVALAAAAASPPRSPARLGLLTLVRTSPGQALSTVTLAGALGTLGYLAMTRFSRDSAQTPGSPPNAPD